LAFVPSLGRGDCTRLSLQASLPAERERPQIPSDSLSRKATAMRLQRSVFVVLGLVLVGAWSAEAAQTGGKGKKGKKNAAVHGMVLDIKKDADKDAGSIVVKVRQGKAKSPDSTTTEKTFKVTMATKFVKATRIAKGDVQKDDAAFKDLQKGAHVTLTLTDPASDEVKNVEIVVRKKNAKKNKGS
jgi:hypothetical protein